jgi:hypothetical protein
MVLSLRAEMACTFKISGDANVDAVLELDHFILAGEDWQEGLEIVKNCERKLRFGIVFDGVIRAQPLFRGSEGSPLQDGRVRGDPSARGFAAPG